MERTRSQKLKLNTITSFILQITNVICGFILPRLILGAFGSEVNGLVNSVAQFLGVISLLDLGVGAVVQSSLYKPLADKDNATISKIYASANQFFKRLAEIMLVYILGLMFFYPIIVNKSFGHLFTASLIAAISISSFAQYYFGIVNSLLLAADQKGFVSYTARIIVLVLNTLACSFLIKFGCSIQIVKLTTSLIFVARPLFLNWYVRKHYSIDKHIAYIEEPIKQKWNGMAQHFASYVLSSTDNIVLTIFSSLENVSIYSVYNLAISGVKNIVFSLSNGLQALMGNMLVKKETEKLKSFFAYLEWVLHTGTTVCFGCTGILIVSFARVYTHGVNDADYIQPLFAILITVANAGHCLRLPYNLLILAAGHYKQTQNNYIIAMIMNIVISIATVKIWGLVGVAIGTLVAMLYQTIWMAWYDSKNIISWPFKNFIKQFAVDIITVLIASTITYKIPLLSVSYKDWFIQAIEVFVCWCVVAVIINYIFYKDILLIALEKVVKKTKKA